MDWRAAAEQAVEAEAASAGADLRAFEFAPGEQAEWFEYLQMKRLRPGQARLLKKRRSRDLKQAKQRETAYAGGEACGDTFLEANPLQPRVKSDGEYQADHSPDVSASGRVSLRTWFDLR